MDIELRPLGVNCNLGCQYCYQNPHRDAGLHSSTYDLDAMKQAIEDEKADGFHLFGGEPLLLPILDLENLWSWGLERFGRNGLQTNGVLLNDAHIALIQKYNVQVGISIDGPGELNDARWAGTLGRTREATTKTEAAIQRLCEVGIAPNLMMQINRCNASPDRLPRFLEWLTRLDEMGVHAIRIHVLENNNPAVKHKYALTEDQAIAAYREIYTLSQSLDIYVAEFNEVRAMLMGLDEEGPCVFRACDPYTTSSVHGVGGHGERHNCGLTDKEGINFQKPEQEGFERYLALYHTPQDYGGCRECRYFLVCKGQCPGTGIDGDWRNRSENCGIWKALFDWIETDLISEGTTPLSLHPRRKELEESLLASLATGKNQTLQSLITNLGIQDAPNQ
jgi:uncharacterized protein